MSMDHLIYFYINMLDTYYYVLFVLILTFHTLLTISLDIAENSQLQTTSLRNLRNLNGRWEFHGTYRVSVKSYS